MIQSGQLFKYATQNFCAVLWAGEQEHDIAKLYYYFQNGRNALGEQSAEQLSQLVDFCKRYVGLLQVAHVLGGVKSEETYQTQVFEGPYIVVVVRRIFPYHIVLQFNRPVSRPQITHLLNLVTLCVLAYQPADFHFQPHPKQPLQPPPPSAQFEQMTCAELDLLLLKFSEDFAFRWLVSEHQPSLLPRDIVSPKLYGIQLIKQIQQNSSSLCVLEHAGRVLLTSCGILMTQFVQLTSAADFQALNQELQWPFATPFFTCASEKTFYLSCFSHERVRLFIVSQAPVQHQKADFRAQLQMLNDKMNQTPAPAAFSTKLLPLPLPISGFLDFAGSDTARFARAFRGVQAMSVAQKQICGSWIDYGILSRAEERQVSELQAFGYNRDAAQSKKRSSENYAFTDSQIIERGLLSHGIREGAMQLWYRLDEGGAVRTVCAGSGDFSGFRESALEVWEVFLRVCWG